MMAALPEMLGLSADAPPPALAAALERAELSLHDQARLGSREAAAALVRLRLAYLRWAYGTGERPPQAAGERRGRGR